MSSEETKAGKEVALGYISAVHGVKGWVKVHSWTRPMEAILDYRPWLLGEDRKPVKIVDGRKQGKGLAVQLPDIDDREQARLLVGLEIHVSREQMPATAPDEFYWSDLVGLDVYTMSGVHMGRVEELMETGANDVLVIKGRREHLVPFIHGQFVKNVSLEDARIDVDWDPEF